jgi:hypothetical protein
MRTMRLTFDEVKLMTTRSGKCAGGCGRRTRRTIRVMQTLNPFNKNRVGVPKSREEILTELRAKLADEKAKPLYCTECEP